MRMNELLPNPGSHPAPKRLGRGIGSGLGKTGGRGHKGQKSRSGGYHKVGFEGGQMPLQRRLPKVGFRSRAKHATAQVRLHELALVGGDVTLESLKAAGLIPGNAERVKIFLSGKLEKACVLRGVGVTAGARAAIEAAGGRVEA
ncbi:50S ribosomal protein L15 [Thioalkalivibrio sp.]|uniref:50S ribosomal protein L15 n=1 Tax=Thioalkalivibrio sp. TaxID=2093813 RepID=UPI0039756EA9